MTKREALRPYEKDLRELSRIGVTPVTLRRDIAIYDMVKARGRGGTKAAAERYNIDPSRVRQVVIDMGREV